MIYTEISNKKKERKKHLIISLVDGSIIKNYDIKCLFQLACSISCVQLFDCYGSGESNEVTELFNCCKNM